MIVKSMTFKSQASFKRQLVSFFVVSICILAIITSIVTAWQTSQQIRRSTIENGVQVSKNFSDQSVLALLTDSKENGQEAADRVLGFKSVNAVAVYKVGGELLTLSTKSRPRSFIFDQTKLIDTTQLIEESDDFWLFSAPVFFTNDEFDSAMVDPEQEPADSQLIGYVLVEYSKQGLHEIQRSIFISNIVIGGGIAIILSFLMSIGISRLTKPLIALSQTMETARDSSIYPKAHITGASDIRQMAEIYNQMMSHLENQNSAMEKHQSTLESEVEMRTLELKVARDTALTASRHKSEFLANISHELRTPLQAIIGYTDLVKEDLELECMDAQVEDLEKSIRAAHNLLGLINNILDLAKIEAGKMDLYVKPTDTEYLVNDAIETVLPMAATNNNKLVIEKGELSPTLILDRQKLMQIFLNLLSNACKFTKNGKITFAIHNDKHFLYFSVKDTGVGIPKNQLDLIFEQFTQVDGSQTRKFEGTGLGMAITKTYCELMQGKMEVTSELGVGTLFSIRLPLIAA
jgi:two-component system, NarL family, sensor histidine kinase BarA